MNHTLIRSYLSICGQCVKVWRKSTNWFLNYAVQKQTDRWTNTNNNTTSAEDRGNKGSLAKAKRLFCKAKTICPRRKKYYLLNVDKVSAYRCIYQIYRQNILFGAGSCAVYLLKICKLLAKLLRNSKWTLFSGKRKMLWTQSFSWVPKRCQNSIEILYC